MIFNENLNRERMGGGGGEGGMRGMERGWKGKKEVRRVGGEKAEEGE